MEYKLAALGWEKDNTNITNKFIAHENGQMATGMGALFGPVGYAMMSAANKTGGKTGIEDLPDYDHRTNAYIGQAYKVPKDMDGLQALHKLIVGKKWKRSAPRIFEIFMKSREERVRDSIRDYILKGKADTSKLSDGELASLVFPYILKQDGKVQRTLGAFRPYPIQYGFKHRPITRRDLESK